MNAFAKLSTDELRQAVARLPRVPLGHLPTPLEETPRMAARLGDIRLFIKRDDCTGLLFGGNKTRHHEFLLGDALQRGADCVVWGAGVQSNNCRQMAAACAKLGLECRLYLSRGSHGAEVQGNLLLDYLVGAKVEVVDAPIGLALEELLRAKADEARREGRRPYVWDRPHVQPIAAASYLLCLAEIIEQLAALDRRPDAIYVSSAGSTGAGLALGTALLGLECPMCSICPIRWPWDVREEMAGAANDAAALLGLPHRLTAEMIDAREDFVGTGYGEATVESRAAMDDLAKSEGILVDPIYTAKALAGLSADVRAGRYRPGATVVFIHTGGLPALFAYRDELVREVDSRR